MRPETEPGREEEPCGNLGFTAFRYIAAEMSAGEAEAFEQRLADDHSAREAVAEMVQLSELAAATLAPCCAAVSAGKRNHWMAPLAWMTAGAAACLALVVTLLGLASHPNQQQVAKVPAPQIETPAKPDHAAVDYVALVRRSAELRDDDPATWQADSAISADLALLGVTAEVQNFDADLTVPDWLLAAVSIGAPSDCIEIQEN